MDIGDFNQKLLDWLIEYNSLRPHQTLDYKSPLEYLDIYYNSEVSPRYSSLTHYCFFSYILLYIKLTMLNTERVVETRDISLCTEPRQRLLREANVVCGDCYCVRQPGISDHELINAARKKLESRKIVILSPIAICDSQEEKLQLIIQNNQDLFRTDNHLVVMDDSPEMLGNAAINLLLKGAFGREVLKRITIINFSTQIPYNKIDPVSGVRLVNLPTYISPFPMHPSPDY